ncbi:hypothetical protein GmRootA79_53600 (plasmid) [Acidovorax sp. A79]|uniref:IPTL-CTERM sorting domain-containing protein n=1 Tax=Acidovorax sp. A79 TaxID=3056107 RepID=UPI0034E83C88
MQTIRTLSAALLLAYLFCPPAGAATFVVNEEGDGIDTSLGDGLCTTTVGHCSLRAALLESSMHAGPHRIEFNVPTAPNTPAVIAPNSPLPVIARLIVIDGTTQPGSSANTLAVGNNAVVNVRLHGANAGAANGLRFDAGASNSVVRGLAITGFQNNGIVLNGLNVPGGLSGVTIAGNFIGTDGSGSIADATGTLANTRGIFIYDGAANTMVGGSAPADRNLIVSGSLSFGISVSSTSTGTQVRGNYIGTNRAGLLRVGTYVGVAVDASGGSGLYGNVIGAIDTGVLLYGGASGVSLQGNAIGVGADGAANIAGSGSGVYITNGGTAWSPSLIRVGGADPGEGNTIAHWGGNGVRVERNDAGAPDLHYHSIRGNSIHSNALAGIELIDTAGGSVTVNSGQPAPAITSATGNAQGTVVNFSLANAAANATHIYEVFSNATCTPQGRTYLGGLQAGTDGSGTYTGSINLPAVPAGSFLTMTATHNFGGNNQLETSEFSGCVQVQAGPGGPGGNPGGPGGPAAIPTLGHAGLALLSGLLAGAGALQRRKRGCE